MSSPLLRSTDDGVALLTFNRPEHANTWSVDLHVAYLQALRDLARDDTVRAVVITGSGRHFCAGADMSLLDSIQNGGELPAELASESFLEPINFPKPLIAAVNGSAAGIGFIHALLCDVRFGSTNAFFTTSFAQRGLVAEHGASWLLPQIVGRAHALDLLLSARRVKADEAAEIGLLHRVVSPEELVTEAMAYARGLVENSSPAAMQVIKQQVTRHATLQLGEAEAETAPLVDASLGSPDFKEGVQSFIEHRSPQFAALGTGQFGALPLVDATQRPQVDAASVAERFFAATSAGDWEVAASLLSSQATLVTYPGAPSSCIASLIEGWKKLRSVTGPWEYLNVRRVVDGNRFCEQHLVRFIALDIEIQACCVGAVDQEGRIERLEEYADGSELRAAVRRHRENKTELAK